jgi:hypothetical protein
MAAPRQARLAGQQGGGAADQKKTGTREKLQKRA